MRGQRMRPTIVQGAKKRQQPDTAELAKNVMTIQDGLKKHKEKKAKKS